VITNYLYQTPHFVMQLWRHTQQPNLDYVKWHRMGTVTVVIWCLTVLHLCLL